MKALGVALGLTIVLAVPASAGGAYTHWLDRDIAHGRNRTVEVKATYTLRQTTTTEDAFVVLATTGRAQTVDGTTMVRCLDATGSYTFQGTFSLDGGQAAILPTSGPPGERFTFPRHCMARVTLTSRKLGVIQADLGIWSEVVGQFDRPSGLTP